MAGELALTRVEAWALVGYVVHRLGQRAELTLTRDSAGALHVLEPGGRLHHLTRPRSANPTTEEEPHHG